MTKLLFVLIVISNISYAGVESVRSGKWGSSSTWSTGKVPSSSDTVLIRSGDSISLSLDTNRCATLYLKGDVYFSSSNKRLLCENVFLESGGKINSSELGSIYCTDFTIVDSSSIEGINLTVSGDFIVSDDVVFLRKSGMIQVFNLHIELQGKWLVPDNQSFLLTGDFRNDGLFHSGTGVYRFKGKNRLSGNNKIKIEKIEITDSLINLDSLCVGESLIGIDSESTLVNSSTGVLMSEVIDSKFGLNNLDCLASGNVFICARQGNQSIPKTKKNSFYDLIISNASNAKLTSNVNVYRDFKINDNSSFTIDSFTVTSSGNKNLFSLDSLAAITFNCTELMRKNFFTNFSKYDLHPRSFVDVNSNSVVVLDDNIEFGSLKVTYTNIGICKVLAGSALKIRGDLRLNSKLFMDISFCSLEIGGDWYGGKLHDSRQSAVAYNGGESQRIGTVDYDTLIIENTAVIDTVHGTGVYSIKHLKINEGTFRIGSIQVGTCAINKKGALIVGSVSPQFVEALQNNGQFSIYSNSSRCTFHKGIRNNGFFENKSNSNHVFRDTIFNNGTFIGCGGTACTWEAVDNTVITGDSVVYLARINLLTGDTMRNKGQLDVSSEIKGNGYLYNLTGAKLSLGMNASLIEASINANSNNQNMVVFNSLSAQDVGGISSAHFSSVTLRGGEKNILNDLQTDKVLNLDSGTTVNSSTYLITGSKTGKFVMGASSTLVLGNDKVDFPTPFPSNFKRDSCFLDLTSTVVYNAWKGQNISTVPAYGNLEVGDGTGVKNIKTFYPNDTVFIKADLSLKESSLLLNINNHHLVIEGSWNGPGGVLLDSGTVKLHGDGLNTGELLAGFSVITYCGDKNQRIKKGEYYDLVVNKSKGRAVLKAGPGELIVKNKLQIERGTMELFGEKVSILGSTYIKDTILFSSKVQDKLFHDVHVQSTGVLDNSYGRNISLAGDVLIEGTWVNGKGEVLFTAKKQKQSLISNGKVVFHRIKSLQGLDTLSLSGSIEVRDSFVVANANLYLENATVDLLSSGYLTGESDSSKITGVNSWMKSSGVIDSASVNCGGLGFVLKDGSKDSVEVKRHFNDFQVYDSIQTLPVTYEVVRKNRNSKDLSYRFKYYNYQLLSIPEPDMKILSKNDSSRIFKYDSGNSAIDFAKKEVYGSFSDSLRFYSFFNTNLLVLPLELIEFKVNCQDKGVVLEWSVNSPWESDYFKIRKSTSNGEFIDFDSVYVTGTQNRPVAYSIVDSTHGSGDTGVTYYELQKCSFTKGCVSLEVASCSASTVASFAKKYELNEIIARSEELKARITNVQVFSIEGKLLSTGWGSVLSLMDSVEINFKSKSKLIIVRLLLDNTYLSYKVLI